MLRRRIIWYIDFGILIQSIFQYDVAYRDNLIVTSLHCACIHINLAFNSWQQFFITLGKMLHLFKVHSVLSGNWEKWLRKTL